MKKVRVSEATGIVLDYLVVKSNGCLDGPGELEDISDWFRLLGIAYSTDWSQGGPIIEREIYKVFRNVGNLWTAMIKQKEPYFSPTYQSDILVDKIIHKSGPTALVAAMRCYVFSKLGDEVEVPDELLEGV